MSKGELSGFYSSDAACFVQNTEPPEKGEKGLTREGKYDKINKLLQENEK